MHTHLAPEFQDTPQGQAAQDVLLKCVHCGFCTATCPTYQVLGDELDGPRGRIYLIKQVLEGAEPTRKTQQHLDRCLTCRNCETTCPSGVEYGHLLDIGRTIVEDKVQRPMGERLKRWTLKTGLTSPLFAPAMKLGQMVRTYLPENLKAKVPKAQDSGLWPTTEHSRKVLMLAGCVQPAMLPNINFATARVLDAVGVQTVVAQEAGCCGALKFHLNDAQAALDQMRRNIDAWWPWVEPADGAVGVECIVMNASGCGVMVKDYGHLLKDDPLYADRAERISALTQDLSEYLITLLPELTGLLQKIQVQAEAHTQGHNSAPPQRVAYHPPCTLQHGQQVRGAVEQLLKAFGADVHLSRTESHLCCGSAGTYSVLQPVMALTLRDRKLEQLSSLQPEVMVSANIGCITHLQSGTKLPVKHWVELVDERLRAHH
ncbi:MAG: glycolate oxidase iron-sulfur subunit [Betaproteobacteria bacterium]|nr:glycolate oxidase iron-sulfur subunit [Betaproteobacteria bacterium]